MQTIGLFDVERILAAMRKRGTITVKHPSGRNLYYKFHKEEEIFVCNALPYQRSFSLPSFMQYLKNNIAEEVSMYYEA